MKKMVSIILVLITIISITGCTISSTLTDADRFKEEYEKENGKKSKSGKENRKVSIPDDNPFVYTTAEELSKKIDKQETFIVYFGFSTCPWCRSVIEELINCAKDNKVDKIYYVDIKDIRDEKELDEDENIVTKKEGTKGYNELLEKLDNVLSDYTTENEDNEKVSLEEKRIYAPNVVAVVNGEATKLEDGISSKLDDPYKKLTKSMRKETYNKFKCIFKCLEQTETLCKTKTC